MQQWHIQLGLAVDQIHGTYHTVKKVETINQKYYAAKRIVTRPSKYEEYQVKWARNFLSKHQPIEL